MAGNETIVPVVMFHSVGLAGSDWVFSYISEPLDLFEDKIRILRKAGYTFIFWNDLYDHMSGRRKAPKKSIMLTFDDGYLDNWVYVYPILKKYDAKGTIFVNPQFVDTIAGQRPTVEDVWNNVAAGSDLITRGFLSWDEMRAMENSGMIDIQSHALTHTWYFSDPQVEAFYTMKDKSYPWMAWNSRPDRKPYYMTEDQSGFVDLGSPIYKHEKALICKRYFPPEKVTQGVTSFVEQHGGESFFKKRNWQAQLCKQHETLMGRYQGQGQVESEADYHQRVFSELEESKREIEEHLCKRIDFICWPGGGYNQTVLDLARQAGYKSWTLASTDNTAFRNTPETDPCQVKRVGAFSRYAGSATLAGVRPGALYFFCGVERHKDSLRHLWLGRMLHIYAFLLSRIRKE